MSLNVSTLQKAEKSITINFPIDKAKESVSRIFSEMGTKFTPVKDGINEIFNTYQFGIANGMNNGIADLSLEAVGDDKTKVNLSVTNAYGATSSNSILEGLANDYLRVLGKVLTGEDIEQEKQAAAKSGSISIILTLIIIAAIGYIIYTIIS